MTTLSQRKANRCALAQHDMEQVLKFLTAHSELSDLQNRFGDSRYFDHCEAILMAAVVTYCRSFKASHSKNQADQKLEKEDFDFFQQRADLLHLHQLLLERRDKAIAHADWKFHNTELLSSNEQGGVLRRISVPDFFSGIDINRFRELANEIRQYCLFTAYDADRLASTHS